MQIKTLLTQTHNQAVWFVCWLRVLCASRHFLVPFNAKFPLCLCCAPLYFILFFSEKEFVCFVHFVKRFVCVCGEQSLHDLWATIVLPTPTKEPLPQVIVYKGKVTLPE